MPNSSAYNFNLALLQLMMKSYAKKVLFLDDLTWYHCEPDSLELRDLLGSSQYEVWNCFHKPSKKELAAKIIPIRKNRNKRDPENFRHLRKIINEIEILHSLKNSQNIVHFYGFIKDKEKIWILMEKMIDTITNILSKYRSSLGYLDNKEYILDATARSCLKALKFCHDKKIIHNDIKPSNILIDKHGIVKLGDFGEATRITEKSYKGTILYMSPNRFRVKDGSYQGCHKT